MNSSTSDVLLQDASPETICFVGDSQARVFDGLLFADPSRPGVNILTTVRRRPYFRAADFFDGDRFDEHMTRVWWELGCARPTSAVPAPDIFTPLVYRVFEDVLEHRRVAPHHPQSKTIVVSCGVDGLDLEEELFRKSASIAGPRPRGFDLFDPYTPREIIEQPVMEEQIARRLAPLFAGLLALRDAGFTRLFLWGFPPPTPVGPPRLKPAQLRYLVRSTFNRVYERFAAENGIGYLSIWDHLAGEDGLRDERFFEDLEHINVQGAIVVMNVLQRALRDRAAASAGTK